MKNAIDFYILANALKYKIRGGCKIWHIKSKRLESVAEHVYGTCILAIALESELNLKVDLNKVLKMLVIHEIGEVIIGDITPHHNMTKEEKLRKEHEAVQNILDGLIKKDEYLKLFEEFNESKTEESKFAHRIDKMEATLQMKLYDEYNYIDIHSEENKDAYNSDFFQKYKKETLSEQFFESDKEVYDNDFIEIGEYVLNNEIKNNTINVEI